MFLKVILCVIALIYDVCMLLSNNYPAVSLKSCVQLTWLCPLPLSADSSAEKQNCTSGEIREIRTDYSCFVKK